MIRIIWFSSNNSLTPRARYSNICIRYVSPLHFSFNLSLVCTYRDCHTTKTTIRPLSTLVRHLCIVASIVTAPLSSVSGLSKTLLALWSQSLPLTNKLFTLPCWGGGIWSQPPHETLDWINKSLMRLCRRGEGLFESAHRNCPENQPCLVCNNPPSGVLKPQAGSAQPQSGCSKNQDPQELCPLLGPLLDFELCGTVIML